ncbi:unnamed protein product, partial [Mycena citricolor]
MTMLSAAWLVGEYRTDCALGLIQSSQNHSYDLRWIFHPNAQAHLRMLVRDRK